jgi:hypothetical protein
MTGTRQILFIQGGAGAHDEWGRQAVREPEASARGRARGPLTRLVELAKDAAAQSEGDQFVVLYPAKGDEPAVADPVMMDWLNGLEPESAPPRPSAARVGTGRA